jgi:outer membrane lipoprotein-sorting protein
MLSKRYLYIDEANSFPIYQEMNDDKGLYEKYEYNGLKVNPTFAGDEFTEEFS